MPKPPEICPICGEYLEDTAKSCPECGACHETGWSEAAKADTLGIPHEDFDYDEFVSQELAGKSPKQSPMRWFWWAVALMLLILMALTFAGAWQKL